MQGRVLIVAGSDSGGAAGIQADLKTVTALGGYGMTAITALTAQNTLGVFGVHGVPAAFIRQQMEVVLDDLGADAVKTGMLHLPAIIETVASVLEEKAPDTPLILDPVMYSKSGDALINPDGVDTLRRRLIPKAVILTPNLPEARALSKLDISNIDDMKRAADLLLKLGCQAVLIKGGHADTDPIDNVLATHDGMKVLSHPRMTQHRVHGTGDTLASAIATGIAQKMSLSTAVIRALEFIQAAIRTAPGYGQGYGPMNHAVSVHPFMVSGDSES